MDQLLEALIVRTGPGIHKMGMAIAVWLSFWLAGIVSRRVLQKMADSADQEGGVILTFLSHTSESALILIGTIVALGSVGIQVSALVASLGLVGFAIGFALRDALSNLLAGAMILFYKPFRHGDRISVTGLEGEVARINMRYTTLKSESKDFLIPNALLLNHPITLIEHSASSPLKGEV